MHQVMLTGLLICCLLVSGCTSMKQQMNSSVHSAPTYADFYNRPRVSVRKWVTSDIVDGMITVNGDWQNARFHADRPSESIITKLKGQIDAFDWVDPGKLEDGIFISTNFYGPTAIAHYSKQGNETVAFANDGYNVRLTVFEDGSYAFNNVVESRKLVSVYLGNIVTGSAPAVLVESDRPDIEYRVEAGSRRLGKLFIYRRVSDDKESSILIYDIPSKKLERTHTLQHAEQLTSLAVATDSDRWCMATIRNGTDRLLSCYTLAGETIGQRKLDGGSAVRLSISNNGQWLSILQRSTPPIVSTYRVASNMEPIHVYAFDENHSADRAVVNDDGDKIAFSGSSFTSPGSAGVVNLNTGVIRCLGCTLLDKQDAAVPRYSSYSVKPTIMDHIGERRINVHVFEPAIAPAKATIIYLHGGPKTHISRTYNIAFFYQSMVRGYRIVAPNVRGSTDQDAAFEAADNGFARINAVQDVKDVVADAVSRYGKPVFLLGDSFAGNYVFASAIGESDIAGVGCVSCVYSRSSIFHDTPEAIIEVGDSRSSDVQTFWDKLEPMSIAHKLKVPSIVVGGEKDRLAPVDEMQRFVDEVVAHGGKIEKVSLPGAVHALSDIVTGEQKVSAVCDFFDRLMETTRR